MKIERISIVCEHYNGILVYLIIHGKIFNAELKKENAIWKMYDPLTKDEFEREVVNEALSHPSIKEPLENKIIVTFDKIHSVKAEEANGIIFVTFMYQEALLGIYLKNYNKSWFMSEYSANMNDTGWLCDFEVGFIEKLITHPSVRLYTII